MSEALSSDISIIEKHIVNHDIMHCTAEGVLANHLYSGRALGMSQPSDIIQLHPELKPLWKSICAHYDRVGLTHSNHVIWNVDMRELGRHICFQPSVFYFGPEQSLYWGDRNWLETVDFINSKNNFVHLAQELEVPIPWTLTFDGPEALNDEVIAKLDFPCYLKAAISVAGVGIFRCGSEKEFIKARDSFGAQTPLQIQQEVITDVFLNLQYRVTQGKLERLVCTEQILDGFAHEGNKYPASHQPWDVVEPMAEWLVKKGMRGLFAFDVAVIKDKDGIAYKAIECNPRFNGASYPTMVVQKLDIGQWVAKTYHTRYRHLDQIDLVELEYNPQTGSGIIVVNWGPVLVGKLVILLAGDEQQQNDLDSRLKSTL